MDYYNVPAKSVLKEFKSPKEGLSEKEVSNRLIKYGHNKIEKKYKISRLKIFANQFRSFLVIILIIAAVVSGALGEMLDATIILIIVVANAFFGFVQEYKAEKAIEALKKLTSPKTTVLRQGKIRQIPAENVVPGDILVLEEGASIPADARIIEQYNLRTNESSLTGESIPVNKTVDPVKAAIIAEMKNMVWMGTTIISGKCKAVVVSTGMKTQIGEIAESIQSLEETSPLQKNLAYLGKQIGVLILVIAAIISLTGIFILKADVLEMFIMGVALAVAAIPEGLPAVATLTLALGIRTMSTKNAIIRRLPAVETLGSTSIICSDKTGTLTKNQMAVTSIYLPDKFFNPIEIKNHNSSLLLKTAALCNNAVIENGSSIGDPTEIALLKVSEDHLGKKHLLEKKEPLVTEIPFSSERKMMSIVRKTGGKKIIYSKGAVEIILAKCSKIQKGGKILPLKTADKNIILKRNKEMTSKALRVLAFAYKEGDAEKDLIFLGMIGMIDPPRDEAKEAIRLCKSAGIRVVMITGDHANTAKAIANEIGILGDVITGEDLDSMSEKDLVKASKANIYARVSPHHKSKILEALKKQNHIVAMTGDGVNDAPAIKRSDIGISMGITGTDVAKEASDIVLKDDNFSSIVVAVKEGRTVYDNIRKFVQLLLSANMAEVLLIAVSVIIGFQFGGEYVIPLTAIQILWINLVTDGLPALALGVDPPAKNIMERKPRNPNDRLLNKNMFVYVTIVGVITALIMLYLFSILLPESLDKARTIVFTSLVVFELLLPYAIRKNYGVSLFTNKYLFFAILSSFLLQLVVIYTPFLQPVFQTIALNFFDWVYVLVGPLLLFSCLYVYSAYLKR